jgi:hypothetical protein
VHSPAHPLLAGADIRMVQNIEKNDQVRSVVGRFADLAGKRALVTGDVCIH